MSDIQAIPVRIKILGPQFWQFIVEDAETGRRLPVQIGKGSAPFTLRVEDGYWVADVTLLVHEVDATMPAIVTEQVEKVSPSVAEYIETWNEGTIIRRPPPEAPPETVDDFAARTVALILESK